MSTFSKYILNQLDILFENPKGELNYNNDFELLVAVVLSAQTTDSSVNLVTKKLFKKYDTPSKLARASLEDVKEIIKSLGFTNKRALSIISLSIDLEERFFGVVPSNRIDLESLSGVGRKTASVVLANAFNIPNIAVDTHMKRVSIRLGIANENDSLLVIEEKIKQFFLEKDWNKVNHQLILFGRYHCKAKNPSCKTCPFYHNCTYFDKNILK